MGILINRLLILLNESSPDSTNYHIALIVLQNIQAVRDLSINSLAELCDVSKSTISKFIRELGYRDFADFRYATEFEDVRFRPANTFVHDVMGYLKDHSYEEYAHDLAEDLTENVSRLDEPNLDRLARDILSHENVAAFGLMFSETAAIDLQTKLGRVGKFIRTSQNDLKQFEYIRNADENTLIIVFSESGGFPERYEMVDRETGKSVFAETKAKLVMITANEKIARDRRFAYIVKMQQSKSVHTHRMIYPLLTDILTYKCYTMLNACPPL